MSTYSYSKTRKIEMSLFSYFFPITIICIALFGLIWGQSKNNYLALKQIMLIFGLKFYCIPCSSVIIPHSTDPYTVRGHLN